MTYKSTLSDGSGLPKFIVFSNQKFSIYPGQAKEGTYLINLIGSLKDYNKQERMQFKVTVVCITTQIKFSISSDTFYFSPNNGL